MDDANAARTDAVNQEMAKMMGLGPRPGAEGADQTAGPGVESYAVPSQTPQAAAIDPNAQAAAAQAHAQQALAAVP
ncbi:hypothetical protein ACLFKT_18755, partial [Paraburkholderia sp. BR14261]